ncbi:MAG: autotransporter-associated beta strand repeat-containing protein [Thermoguttaceae bacterium]|jgi:autotransporter-associated beta strand protein|nr:autotransporter-associated beta strand repeat-containing protein [Thermoguttaceae bacterium]
MLHHTASGVFALAAALFLGSTTSGATIGYWRFEGTGSDWLLDSSGSANQHNLTMQGSPLQYALPATGPGSVFPNPIPLTGQTNQSAARLDQSGTKQWFTAPDDDDFTFAAAFTVEGFLNIDSTSGSAVVAGHWDGTSANQRSWFLDVVGGSGALRVYLSPNGSSANAITSSLAIAPNKDYFVGAAVELAESGVSNSGTVTFYLKNLTDGGPMVSETKSHSTSGLYDSSAPLAIGSRSRSGGYSYFPGIIDEVRLTDGALNSGQLLSPNSLYFSRADGRTSWGNTTPNVWATTSGGPDYDQPWSDGANAHFEGTGDTVTVSGTINSVNSMAFDVGGYTLSGGTVTLTGDATIYASGANVYPDWTNISSRLTGNAGLTKTGPGDIVLRSGSNDYSGGTFIEEGRIVIGDGNNRLPTGTTVTLGSGDKSGALHLGWATGTTRQQELAGLLTSGTGTGNRVTGAGSGSNFSTLTLNIAETNVFDGILGGPGSGQNQLNLIKTGAGTLTLTGANTYTGYTRVSNGILSIEPASSGGTLTSPIEVQAGAQLHLGGGSTNLSGDISGGGSLHLLPGGFFRLSGDNASLTGDITISGRLRVGSATALGDPSNAVTMVSGSFLDLNGWNTEIGSLAGHGTVRNAIGSGPGSDNPTMLTVGGNNHSTEFFGVIQNGGGGVPLGLRKVGTGEIILRGVSTFTGGTFIEEGRIVIGDGNNRLPTGTTVTLGSGTNSGALHLGWGTSTPRNQTLAGLVTSGTGTGNRVAGAGSSSDFSTLTLNIAETNVFDGTLGGPGSGENRLNLTKTGDGTLTLSGINTYVGDTEVTGAGILRAGSNQAFGDNSALTVGSNAVVELNGWSLAVGSIAGSGIVRNAPGSDNPGSDDPTVFTVGGNNDSTEFSGVFEDGDGGVPLSLRKVGTGELILRGESTYSGDTAIEDGRLVLGTGTNRLPTGTIVTLGGGTTSGELSVGGGTSARSQTLAGLLTSGTGTDNRVVGAGTSATFSTLTLNIADTNVFDGTLGGPGTTEDRLNLTKTGEGTLTLLTANTHVGDTRVNAGTLALGHVDALQHSTLDTGSSGSQQVTFAVAGTNTYNLGGLKGSDALDFAPNSISVGSNHQDTTFSGNLVGTGTLTKVGDGRLSLAGDNRNFSGHTQIDSGILRLTPSSGHQFPSSFDVAPDGELQLGGTDGVNLSGSISGAGPIHLLEGGFYRISGNNSFTSDFTLDGRLRIGSSTALGNVNNAVTMGSGASLELYGWNLTIGSLAGSGIVQNRSDSGSGSVAAPVLTTGGNHDSTVFSGVIQDGTGSRSVGLVKEGAGVFTLAGNSIYTGATVVNAGTLLVDGSLLGTSGVTVTAGATLGGSGVINATVGGAGLVSPGSSPGVLAIGQFDPSGGLGTALEFTAIGPPDFGNAAASENDLLRISDAVPFTQPLDGSNAIDVYFDIAGLTAGDTVQGGFYTDAADDFLAAIENAAFAYWVMDDGLGTDRVFNGQGYYSLEDYASWLTVDVSTLAMEADFGAGPVFGRIAQFAVVPEPGAALLLLSALASGLLLRRRRAARG